MTVYNETTLELKAFESSNGTVIDYFYIVTDHK